ncbi:MAG: hypothetical protein VB017_07100 [Endomicrobiaceae bacterium]|nr:hypothetical protein [Endomicrobiaceae bacterium]
MFYKNKISFFIVLGIISFILYYFIDQQIVLIGLLNNFIISIGILFFLIIFISFFSSLIMLSVMSAASKIYTKITGKQARYSKKFALWLNFTVMCYIVSFIIFLQSITY